VDTSVIVIAGCVLVGLSILPGLYLWWPSRADPASRGGLGAALLTGAVVSFAVFALQILFDARLRQIDDRRQRDQERRSEQLRVQGERTALQLTVGLQRNLTGIDLHGRDLSGFYLSRKQLDSADLNGANLRKANLSQADLRKADLREARLEQAHLDGADLADAVLTQANLTGAGLVQAKLGGADLSAAVLVGADLRGADLGAASVGGASFKGAEYDADTKLPESVPHSRCPRGKSCKLRGP
jgi:uncharacterized protein YjbI with pentapeptide repeats